MKLRHSHGHCHAPRGGAIHGENPHSPRFGLRLRHRFGHRFGLCRHKPLSAPAEKPHNDASPLEYRDTVLPPIDKAMRTQNRIRLFVCVGRHCRQAWNGVALIDALRAAIAEHGESQIDVQSCGCQDMCEQGPVVLAFAGSTADKSHPPKGTLEKLFHRPMKTFTHVSADRAGAIVAAVLAKKGR